MSESRCVCGTLGESQRIDLYVPTRKRTRAELAYTNQRINHVIMNMNDDRNSEDVIIFVISLCKYPKRERERERGAAFGFDFFEKIKKSKIKNLE